MISVLNIFTIFNLTLLGGILFFKKNNSISTRVLGIIVFIPAITFAWNYFLYTGWLYKCTALTFFNLNMLWAPFVLWYVLLMLGEEIKLNYKHLFHLIPFGITFFFEVLLYVQSDEYKYKFLYGIFHGNYPWQLAALNLMLLFQSGGYLAYSYIRIKRYVKSYENSGVAEDRIVTKINWVKTFIQLLIGLDVVAIALSGFVTMEDSAYIYTPLLYDIAFYMVIAGAIRNSTLFSEAGFQKYVAAEKENKEKYLNSSLTQAQIEEFHQKLVTHLLEEKSYLKPELTLKDLSEELAIPQHHLSQLINQKFNKNFFDLINSHRVEEAKARLKNIEKGNLTVEGIGLECGFGSSSAFYRAFKKNTGVTPGQYLKQSEISVS